MTGTVRMWLGVGGVPPGESKLIHQWEERLRWLMITVAALSVPAAIIDDLATKHGWREGVFILDLLIFSTFAGELMWMLRVSERPWRYLRYNWLDVVIVIAAAAALFGSDSEWIAVARLLRLTLVSLLMLRLLTALRELTTPQGVPFLLAFGFVSLALAGAGFYFLEPTIHSYWDGVWLAFVTGTTVGYGDLIPTTALSRLFAAFMIVVGFGTLSLVVAQLTAFLVGQDEIALRRALHGDIRQLRADLTQLVGGEEQHVLRTLHHEISELRKEMTSLRRQLAAKAEPPP